MVSWHFYPKFLKLRDFRDGFQDQWCIFFFQKSFSVKTLGSRHHVETFMKLLIDFFLRGKMFCTHFPGLFFNSKHYVEEILGIKGSFFSSSSITWASQGKVF